MWAPEYLAPAAGTSRFELNDALMLRLGQRLFDTHLRGSDLDLGATPVVAKDLASIVELLLRSADLASLLDGSIVVGGGGASLTIDLTRVDLGSVRTDRRSFAIRPTARWGSISSSISTTPSSG